MNHGPAMNQETCFTGNESRPVLQTMNHEPASHSINHELALQAINHKPVLQAMNHESVTGNES